MDIMRGDQDGVEFYTILTTGIGGMSLVGTGRLAGVDRSNIS